MTTQLTSLDLSHMPESSLFYARPCNLTSITFKNLGNIIITHFPIHNCELSIDLNQQPKEYILVDSKHRCPNCGATKYIKDICKYCGT
jgi:hypothetical protein